MKKHWNMIVQGAKMRKNLIFLVVISIFRIFVNSNSYYGGGKKSGYAGQKVYAYGNR